jgi:ankyrin repeat protein
VSLFLEHEVSVNLADEDGRTPLHFALGASKKSLSFLRFLFKHGADANAATRSDQSALHWALKIARTSLLVGDVEICRCLIEAGADVQLKDPILVRLSLSLSLYDVRTRLR